MKATFESRKQVEMLAKPLMWLSNFLDDDQVIINVEDDNLHINATEQTSGSASSKICWVRFDTDVLFEEFTRQGSEQIGIYYLATIARIFALFGDNTELTHRDTLTLSQGEKRFHYRTADPRHIQEGPKALKKDKIDWWCHGKLEGESLSEIRSAASTLEQDLLRFSAGPGNDITVTVTDSIEDTRFVVDAHMEEVTGADQSSTFQKSDLFPVLGITTEIETSLSQRVGYFRFAFNDACRVKVCLAGQQSGI